jgi:hypothetical protein
VPYELPSRNLLSYWFTSWLALGCEELTRGYHVAAGASTNAAQTTLELSQLEPAGKALWPAWYKRFALRMALLCRVRRRFLTRFSSRRPPSCAWCGNVSSFFYSTARSWSSPRSRATSSSGALPTWRRPLCCSVASRADSCCNAAFSPAGTRLRKGACRREFLNRSRDWNPQLCKKYQRALKTAGAPGGAHSSD